MSPSPPLERPAGASSRRNRSVETVNTTAAITASTTSGSQSAPIGVPRTITPRATLMNQVSGSRYPIQRTAHGIEYSGKKRPLSRNCGTMVMTASCSACAWVWETLEMRTPVPSVTKRKSSAPSAKVATDPRKGTSNSSMPATTTTTMSAAAMSR